MGENVREGQVKSFRKGADRALRAMKVPTLFEREEIVVTTFTAQPTAICDAKVGDVVNAYSAPDKKSVLLTKGHEVIAQIFGDGAMAIQDGLAKPHGPRAAAMLIADVCAISGYLTVKVLNEGLPHDK